MVSSTITARRRRRRRRRQHLLLVLLVWCLVCAAVAATNGDHGTSSSSSSTTSSSTTSSSSSLTTKRQEHDQPSRLGKGNVIVPKIINGENAPEERFPYTVSLQSVTTLNHFCGGSLVAPDVVLSAAHCQGLPQNMAVRTNPYRLTNPTASSRIFQVDQVLIHPLYATNTAIDHDFMLLKLRGSIDNDNNDLLRVNQNANLPLEGQRLTVMGWGTTKSGVHRPPQVLQTVNVYLINNQLCVQITLNGTQGTYEGEVTDDMLCTIEAGSGSCQGDSGGPLIIPGTDSSGDVQVGVVSWGIDCSRAEYPGVYARVSWGFDFIRAGVCQLSNDPPNYFNCSGVSRTLAPTPVPTTAPMPTVSPVPTVEQTAITVQIALDFFSRETGWQIEAVDDGTILHKVNPGTYVERSQVVTETVYVPPGNTYFFVLIDTYGDGICCLVGTGSAYVFLGDVVDYDRVLLMNDGRFAKESIRVFVADPSGIIPASAPSVAPSISTLPSASPTRTASPTNQLTVVTVVVYFDTYPVQTSWTITSNNRLMGSGGPYSPFLGDHVMETIELETNVQHTFTIYDENGICCGDGDGSAFVYLGTQILDSEVLVFDNGRFEGFRSHTFVASPTDTFFVTQSPTTFPSQSVSPTTSPAPTRTVQSVLVVMRLDRYPGEIMWEIVDASSNDIVQTLGPFESTKMFDTIRTTVALGLGGTYFFVVRDFFGDGFCCNGFAAVYFGTSESSDHVLAYETGNFGQVGNHTMLVSEDGFIVVTPAPFHPMTETPTATPTVSPAPSRSPTNRPTTTPTISPFPTSSTQVSITVEIHLDQFPLETGWSLLRAVDEKPVVEIPTGTYQLAESTITKVVSVDHGREYIFEITDASLNGICCNFGEGSVYIYLGTQRLPDRVILFEDGSFQAMRRQSFVASTDGLLGFTNHPSVSLVPSDIPTMSAEPSLLPSKSDAPSVSMAPTRTPVPVSVFITLDRFPAETSWSIKHASSGDVILSVTRGTYQFSDAFQRVNHTVELAPDQTYLFTISDRYGDGICCNNGDGFALIYLGLVPRNDMLLLYDDGEVGYERTQTFVVSPDAIIPVTFPTTSPTESLTPSVSFAPSMTASPTQPATVSVWITLDDFPRETAWSIFRVGSGVPEVSIPAGTYTVQDAVVNHTVRLLPGEVYLFIISDRAGNGICCQHGNGRALVYLGTQPLTDMVLAYENGQFGTGRSQTFVASLDGIISVSFPTASPSVSQFPSQSVPPTLSASPTQAVLVSVWISLDRFPAETSWWITQTSTDRIVFAIQNGDYGSKDLRRRVNQTIALSPGEEYTFTITDVSGDGVCCNHGGGDVFVYFGTVPSEDMVLVFLDGRFGSQESVKFVASPEAILSPTMAPSTSAMPTTPHPSALPTTVPSTSMPTTPLPSFVPSDLPTTASPTFPPTSRPTVVQLPSTIPSTNIPSLEPTQDGPSQQPLSLNHPLQPLPPAPLLLVPTTSKLPSSCATRSKCFLSLSIVVVVLWMR